jgi:hypothetical protein
VLKYPASQEIAWSISRAEKNPLKVYTAQKINKRNTVINVNTRGKIKTI